MDTLAHLLSFGPFNGVSAGEERIMTDGLTKMRKIVGSFRAKRTFERSRGEFSDDLATKMEIS